jgi:adenylate cyclase
VKKLLVQLSLGLAVAVAAIAAYLFLPSSYLSLDNRIRDFLFLFRGSIPVSGVAAIADIDEKSLAQLGQWPWERDKIAKLLQNLSDAGAGIIGLDAVFAEPDNSSPKRALTKIGMLKEAENADDYDAILGETIGATPTVTGFVFIMERDEIEAGDAPPLRAVFIERDRGDFDSLLKPYRSVLNVPIIQDQAYSGGYFNTLPDDDSGIIRNVPLIMEYDGTIYPSLSLEMIRIALNESRVTIEYDPRIGAEKIIVGDIEIPTDRYGRIFINYRGGGKSFDYISAADIYNNRFDRERVEGKFVLVGTSATGLLDLRATPFDNVYPGVEIHASVIDNVMTGDFISRPSWIIAVDILMILSAALFLSLILAYASPIVSFASIILYTSAFLMINYWAIFSYGLILNLLIVLLTIVAVSILALAVNFFMESRQKDMIRARLAKKVSPSVVADLLKNPNADILEGRDREITIYFSDIRGFTSISEAMERPKDLITYLNDYMTPMTDIIIEREGTVDKFIGDAIMAYWNAPNNVEDHRDKAVSAALLQLEALKRLNERLAAENKPLIEIGIGLNTGTATVGEMGSKDRADYTAIGDAVNLASRLEALNKVYRSGIIISQYVKEGLKGEYIIRELDCVRVKGKRESVSIYEVIDFGKPDDELKAQLEAYDGALRFYRNADFEKAQEAFEELNAKCKNPLYETYIDRCKELTINPPENFDGVFTFTTK